MTKNKLDNEAKETYRQIIRRLKIARQINRNEFVLEWGNGILDEELSDIIARLEEAIE